MTHLHRDTNNFKKFVKMSDCRVLNCTIPSGQFLALFEP